MKNKDIKEKTRTVAQEEKIIENSSFEPESLLNSTNLFRQGLLKTLNMTKATKNGPTSKRRKRMKTTVAGGEKSVHTCRTLSYEQRSGSLDYIAIAVVIVEKFSIEHYCLAHSSGLSHNSGLSNCVMRFQGRKIIGFCGVQKLLVHGSVKP